MVILSALILNPRAERRRQRERTVVTGAILTELSADRCRENPNVMDLPVDSQLGSGVGKHGFEMDILKGQEAVRPQEGGGGCEKIV